MNGTEAIYEPDTGNLMVGEEEYYIGENQEKFAFLIDDKILEVDVNCGIIIGVFVLEEGGNIPLITAGCKRLLNFAGIHDAAMPADSAGLLENWYPGATAVKAGRF